MGESSPSRIKILQSGLWPALSLALVFILLATSSAQSTKKKTGRGPRAVAVVEWFPSGPRLTPISILIDGKFYDATLYLADPVPMALDPGNVYEVQKAGDPAGIFTVDSVMQVQNGGFYGVGKFRTQVEVDAAAKKAAAAKATVRAPSARQTSEDEGPPRLHRKGSKSGSPSGSPPNNLPVPDNGPPPSSSPGGTDDSDSDRPTLKRAPEPVAAAPASAASASPSAPPADDPDRPALKRGGGAELQAAKIPASPSPVIPAAPKAQNRIEVAVSDPNPSTQHPFRWVGKPDFEERDRDATRQLALQAVRDYAAKHPGVRPGSVIQYVQVHAFDLDYNNTAIFVLSATIPPGSAKPAPPSRTGKTTPVKKAAVQEPGLTNPSNDLYVTVVARENYDGTMRRIFATVTDSSHLDVYPRLELIDAVDAQGDGRGELLFRQISDTSRSYVIYRVGVETLTALFNSGAPLEQ